MVLGFHAPFPPARTGIADYAEALAVALKPHIETIAINPSEPCPVDLYHLGNNQLHRAIYRRAIERPGIAVLHDAVLHHFFLGCLPEDLYIEEFVYNYGEWYRGLAGELWQGRARSAQDPRYFRYPMLARLARRARAMVVHNPAAARMVRAHNPRAHITEIPHLFQPPEPPDAVELIGLRERLGVAASAPLFGVFGFLRESKRLPVIWRAFGRVRSRIPNAALLVAGEFASSDLERALDGLGPAGGLHRTGYLDEHDFWAHARVTDVCLNLRHPAAGETSGIAIRMMGIGKPVLVTAGDESSRFPDAACVRIDAGPAEEEMLTANMLWLAEDPAARRRIGRQAEKWIAAEHNLERCAARYLDVIRAAPPAPAGTGPFATLSPP